MKATYRVTLLRLSADATSIEPLNHLPLELGEIAPAALLQLLENFAQFDILAVEDEDPTIVIRRGDKGWRVTLGSRCLMFHDGVGTLDPIFPLDPAGVLVAIAPGGTIPPFRPAALRPVAPAANPARGGFSRSTIFVLIVLGLILLALGLWFGLHKKNSDDVPEQVATQS